MNVDEFYGAIRHKFEAESLSKINEELLTHSTKAYLALFRIKGYKPLFISQNIPAIFLGTVWFLYRRMYVLAFLTYIVWFIIEYFLRQFCFTEETVELFMLGFYVYLALFANSLYINNVRRRFAKGLHSRP